MNSNGIKSDGDMRIGNNNLKKILNAYKNIKTNDIESSVSVTIRT